jgi:hypothetical protein
MGLAGKVSVLALVLWMVYEARRLHQEFTHCEAAHADNLVYLAQPMCTDATYRALWEGKRVHCGEAERANQEHRLACAYRQWWDTSDWRVFWLQVTGNHWLLTASLCTAILGTLWLISTILAGRREDARAGKLLDMQAQFMQTATKTLLPPAKALGENPPRAREGAEAKQLEPPPMELHATAAASAEGPDAAVIYLRARPAAPVEQRHRRRLVGKRTRYTVEASESDSESE